MGLSNLDFENREYHQEEHNPVKRRNFGFEVIRFFILKEFERK